MFVSCTFVITPVLLQQHANQQSSSLSLCCTFFFFNDTATTEIYTLHIVGSVRCVQETASPFSAQLFLHSPSSFSPFASFFFCGKTGRIAIPARPQIEQDFIQALDQRQGVLGIGLRLEFGRMRDFMQVTRPATIQLIKSRQPDKCQAAAQDSSAKCSPCTLR
eukprot:TRINITY_DN5671_c0_g1_i1.p2 TRINITY_DN5671_c0_g1~~TRINITY_DN5671_c0_g1_i1.p2  ORF type:complete len:163 (+),score=21.46 TRINITY_DN5671_c0_g1_i1:43-531(+)